MTKERVIQILQAYVDNDLSAADIDYVREALQIVATKEENEELGFGWIYED